MSDRGIVVAGRRHIFFLALLGGLVGHGLFGGSAGSADLSKTQPVAEQNVGADGAIRVHEQGTAAVSVAGTPTVKIDASANGVEVERS